ncbi:MAG: hypothetical protein M3N45_09410 [Actinomycetota bacterium]|nr:hypothetical protein [Actinomycetota bacterium]
MSSALICEWCGDEFERPHQRGPRPKFCKESHRQQAYRARQLRRFSEEVQIDKQLDVDRDLAARNFLKRGSAHHHRSAVAEAMKGFDTKAYAATVAEAMKGFDTYGATVAEAMAEEVDSTFTSDGDVPLMVLCIAMLAVLTVMRAQLEATVSALLEAFAAQLLFALDVSAQLQDASPELRGLLGIAAVAEVTLVVYNLARRLSLHDPKQSSSTHTTGGSTEL